MNVVWLLDVSVGMYGGGSSVMNNKKGKVAKLFVRNLKISRDIDRVLKGKTWGRLCM